MSRTKSLPLAIRLFLITALACNLIGLASEGIARFCLHWPAVYTSPGLNEDPAIDLQNFVPVFKHLHTPDFFGPDYDIPYMYPAPVAPLYGFFLNLPHRIRVFLGTVLLILVASAVLFGFALRRRGLSVFQSILVAGGALLLSYPAFFEYKQGNMEIFVCLIVGAGIWCFLNDKFHTAAACFGIAAAMKIFPFVYLALFLARRRYLPLVTAIVSVAVVTVCSLYYICPSLTIAWHGIADNLRFYQNTVVLTTRTEVGFDHSLFALLKLIMYPRRYAVHANMAPLLHIYMLTVATIGAILYFARIQFLPVINQIMCLCLVSVMLPPVSYDYTLLHLYIPWALLVFFAVKNSANYTRGLNAAMIGLALVTSLQTELIHHASTHGGQAKALELLFLFVVALMFKFEVNERRIEI